MIGNQKVWNQRRHPVEINSLFCTNKDNLTMFEFAKCSSLVAAKTSKCQLMHKDKEKLSLKNEWQQVASSNIVVKFCKKCFEFSAKRNSLQNLQTKEN